MVDDPAVPVRALVAGRRAQRARRGLHRGRRDGGDAPSHAGVQPAERGRRRAAADPAGREPAAVSRVHAPLRRLLRHRPAAVLARGAGDVPQDRAPGAAGRSARAGPLSHDRAVLRGDPGRHPCARPRAGHLHRPSRPPGRRLVLLRRRRRGVPGHRPRVRQAGARRDRVRGRGVRPLDLRAARRGRGARALLPLRRAVPRPPVRARRHAVQRAHRRADPARLRRRAADAAEPEGGRPSAGKRAARDGGRVQPHVQRAAAPA